MDDQIDPGDNFFGVNLSDCVTVTANSPSNANTEPQDAPKRPFEQVAGVVAGSSMKDETGTGEFMPDLPVSYYVCWYEERPHNGSNKAEYASFRHAFSRFNSLNTVDGVKDVGIYVSGPQTIRLLADGKISGLQIEHYGIPESDLCKAGWVPTGPNEDAWISPWHTEESESDWTLQPIPFKQVAAVVTVTDEMIAAGKATYAVVQAQRTENALPIIYRAMAAVAPPAPGKCPFGDPFCPCQDGDACHYVDLPAKDGMPASPGWPVPIMDSVVGLKAANAHLVRRVAAQALAHAEQMEGEMRRVAVLEETEKALRKVIEMKESRIGGLKSQLAMRVTPATQPTASDVKAAPERRPDGTLKPAAKAWEAPKRTTDVRRIGG